MFVLPDISQIVALALAEDLGVPAARFLAGAPASTLVLARDVTTFSAIGIDAHFTGRVVARQDAVVCGLPVAAAVFDALSTAAGLFDEVEVFPLVAEGSHVSAGTPVLEIGPEPKFELFRSTPPTPEATEMGQLPVTLPA